MKIAAENSHDRIANKFIDITALCNDLFYHHIKIIIQQFYNRIR